MPVSTGGQWQTSDGNKHDSMGAAQIAQDNINSGKNWTSDNQPASSSGQSIYDDPAYAAKNAQENAEFSARMRKAHDKIAKLDRELMNSLNEKLDRHREDSYICRNNGDWEGVIREMKLFIQLLHNPDFIQSVEELLNVFANDYPDEYRYKKAMWEAIRADEPLYNADIAFAYSHLADPKYEAKDYEGAINYRKTAVLIYPFNDELRDGLIKWLASQYAHFAVILYNDNIDKFVDDIIFNYNAALVLDSSTLKDGDRKNLAAAYATKIPELQKQQKMRDVFLVLHRWNQLEDDQQMKDAENHFAQQDSSLLALTKNEKEFNKLLITAGLPPQRADELKQIADDILVKHPAASLPRISERPCKYNILIAEHTTELAQAGNDEAQYTLGLIYSKGQFGLPQDKAKAKQWYEKAAKQGHAEAKAELAKLGK
jgi:hypothetical protein